MCAECWWGNSSLIQLILIELCLATGADSGVQAVGKEELGLRLDNI